ncbi:MAG TPA: bifunctional riboflavin kinase/FAD synthetase [Actinomycetota bacterium]|nr:bifunctional riboflavin kinase/FAD synthetase [Actinomycetota bacterium]
MKTLFGIDQLEAPESGSVVTIGTFDGVHLGHRALIARAIGEARTRDAAAAILTWDRHPALTLRPEKAPTMLSTPERKIELLSEVGVDILAVVPFDHALSQWPAERFVTDVLVKGLGARAVVVGGNWRFGKGRTGDVALLRGMGEELGFETLGIDLEQAAGEVISSSRIRAAIAAGDLAVVTRLLGRPFDADGVVVHGDDRGHKLGFPTANVEMPPGIAHLPRGVYAGRTRVGGDATMVPSHDRKPVAPEGWYAAAINVGVNPTFGGDPEKHEPRIEAYILDLDADLYGRELRIEFWERLRDEEKFDSEAALIEQMEKDVERTKEIVR